ncbi:MAG TPA: nucleotide exchange factor GrpE [Solirubrobacteraceae bacterium]|jgi:molecular chaperone GrpE|nr:nucleotide exchange factor GrpE [Solirubrobacteraceae bacterium]
MSSEHNNAPDAVKHQQAPEAELPQAPPGAPEGHDASRAQAERPQSEAEIQAQPGTPQSGAPGQDQGRAATDSTCDRDDLAAKAEKAGEYLALAQRTQADFENYRKRATRDAAAAQERGAAKLALALLPAIDNLDRALAHADEVVAGDGSNGAESLVAGLKHVHADLISALGNVGIERYSPEGEPFDPQYHEAVAQQPVEGAQPGVVVEVFQRGYRMGENVVRPARVVVAG